MFKEKYRTYINWGITVLILLVLAISCYFLFLRWDGMMASWRNIAGILAPLSIGLSIAYLLDSLVELFTRLLMHIPLGKKASQPRVRRVWRAVSIALSEILLVAAISTLIRSILPQMIDSLLAIISNIDQYAANLEAWGRPLLDENPSIAPYVLEQFDKLETFVKDFLKNDLLSVITRVTNGLFEVGTYVYNFILGLIVSIYLLFSKNRLIGHFKKLLYALVKPERANHALALGRYTNQVFKGFLVGKLVDSMIIGFLCFLGMTLLRIPYSLLISIIVGVTNVIPYFGPFIGAIPSALLLLMLNPYKCLVFVIFIFLLQQLDGNVIGPKILGNTTGISSLGVLISILIGGGLFGLTGMLLCVPTYSVLYSLIKSASEKKLDKRGLPIQTETYTTLEQIDPETLAAVDSTSPSSHAQDKNGFGDLFRRAFGTKK